MNKKNNAFSLIEILVATSLVIVLTSIMTAFFIKNIQLYRKNEHTAEQQNKISSALRKFEHSARAASSIYSVNTNKLVYYRYFDLTSPSPTEIRFYMEDDNLIMSKTEPSISNGEVVWPDTDRKTEILLSNVQNSDSLFKYFDSNNNEINDITLDTTSFCDDKIINACSKVRMISLSLTIPEYSDNNGYTLSGISRVNLRNIYQKTEE